MTCSVVCPTVRSNRPPRYTAEHIVHMTSTKLSFEVALSKLMNLRQICAYVAVLAFFKGNEENHEK